MKTFSHQSPVTSHQSPVTSHQSPVLGWLAYFKKVPLLILLTLMMMGSSSHLQAQFQTASNAGAIFKNVANATHISCDGYADDPFSPTVSFKVFAWDGSNQGWGYDYNGAKTYRSFTSTNFIYHPEIALVSEKNGRQIYAIILYQEPSVGAYYEIYNWTGSAFSSTPTYSGVLKTGSMTDRVVSVAGDEYGHFVMVCDDGFNASAVLTQLTGFIDGSGNLIFGTIGNIVFGASRVSQPDVDITYDSNHSLKTDAVVVVAFTESNGTFIRSDFNDQTNLFAGTTWDLNASTIKAKQTAGSSQTFDQPSISINDGFEAYKGNLSALGTPGYGYSPVHYGVSFRDLDPTNINGATNDILLYNALVPTIVSAYPISWSITSPVYDPNSATGNNTTANLEINEKPTIVVQPIEIETVVAWNFLNLTNTSYGLNSFEGLANRYWYPYNKITSTFNQPYLAPQSFDMLINFNTIPTSGITTEVAISGYSPIDVLYFYYENGSGDLKYKLASYGTNVLRKAIADKDNKLTIYPNPFIDKIQLGGISTNSNYTASIADITGRVIENANGLYPQIENELNSFLLTIPKGCYLLNLTSQDGTIHSSKLIKQ